MPFLSPKRPNQQYQSTEGKTSQNLIVDLVLLTISLSFGPGSLSQKLENYNQITITTKLALDVTTCQR